MFGNGIVSHAQKDAAYYMTQAGVAYADLHSVNTIKNASKAERVTLVEAWSHNIEQLAKLNPTAAFDLTLETLLVQPAHVLENPDLKGVSIDSNLRLTALDQVYRFMDNGMTSNSPGYERLKKNRYASLTTF